MSMSKFKLPVLEGKISTYPDEPVCPVCKEAKIFEPHSFAFINGGALLMDRKEDSGGSSTDMDAYLTIGWHGAHSEGGDVTDDPEQYSSIDIVNGVVGGQFGLYFCSIKCLRFFLNACIDKLGD